MSLLLLYTQYLLKCVTLFYSSAIFFTESKHYVLNSTWYYIILDVWCSPTKHRNSAGYWKAVTQGGPADLQGISVQYGLLLSFLISSCSYLGKKNDLIHCSQVDELHKEDHFSFRLSSVSFETNMILHNIQRIIQVWIRGYFYLL